MKVYVRKNGNGYDTVGLEHAQILGGVWRNFAKLAKPGTFEDGKKRHFAVLIDDENAKNLTDLGFNVKYYQPKDSEREGYNYLDISIADWVIKDEKISVVSTDMIEVKQNFDTIGNLDHANNIDFADIEITPRRWEMNGASGIKAWLSEMYVYLQEPSPIHQNFEQRYSASGIQTARVTPIVEDEEDIPF